MSYSFDVMRHIYDRRIAPFVPNPEVRLLFGFLIDEMHSANHRLDDGVNKDTRVTQVAKRLDEAENRGSAWNNYPKDWPACQCGEPALDGHLTCGRVTCNEHEARLRAEGR